jgi:hypothetical protein
LLSGRSCLLPRGFGIRGDHDRFRYSSSVMPNWDRISKKSQAPTSVDECTGIVVARPSGCFQRAWLPRCRIFTNPNFRATRSRSDDLAGTGYLKRHIRRQLPSSFFVFFRDHREDIREGRLSLCRCLSNGVAARNRGDISDISPVVIRFDNDRVAIKIGHAHSIEKWIEEFNLGAAAPL